MHKVIERFRDLTDGHLYEAGDIFPHDGRDVGADRLKALENGENRAARPLIHRVEEQPEAPQEQPKKPARARKKTT